MSRGKRRKELFLVLDLKNPLERYHKKGGEKMKKLHFIPLLACLLCAVLSCTVRQEEPQGQEPEEPRRDAILNLVAVTENMFGIDLKNSVFVRGVQFTLEGVTITEVRTTKRSEGFFASFNKENGKVIMASLAGDELPPGKGLIAEVVCDNSGAARLSEIRIAP
jgi:hypothetical protein